MLVISISPFLTMFLFFLCQSQSISGLHKAFDLGKSNILPLEVNKIFLMNRTCSILYCYVPTQLFLALYMCVFIFKFPLWLFLEQDSLLWNIVLEVSGPFYSLITRSYATDFNMNFPEFSLLL